MIYVIGLVALACIGFYSTRNSETPSNGVSQTGVDYSQQSSEEDPGSGFFDDPMVHSLSDHEDDFYFNE